MMRFLTAMPLMNDDPELVLMLARQFSRKFCCGQHHGNCAFWSMRIYDLFVMVLAIQWPTHFSLTTNDRSSGQHTSQKALGVGSPLGLKYTRQSEIECDFMLHTLCTQRHSKY